MRVDVATGELTVVNRDIYGGGGSISPDGTTYAFARADGDRHNLVLLDVASGSMRVLADASRAGAFVSLPRYAPDGQRLVAMALRRARLLHPHLRRSHRRRCWPASPTGGRRCTTPRGPTHHVVYLRSDIQRRRFPGLSLRSAQRTVAPGHPRALPGVRATGGGRALRFLNRDGWRWTLDEQAVSLAAIPAPAPPPTPTATPRPSRPRRRPRPPSGRSGRRRSTTARSGAERRRLLGRPITCVELQTHAVDFLAIGRQGVAGGGEPRRRRPAAVPPLGAERALAAGRRRPGTAAPALTRTSCSRHSPSSSTRWRFATTTPDPRLRRR